MGHLWMGPVTRMQQSVARLARMPKRLSLSWTAPRYHRSAALLIGVLAGALLGCSQPLPAPSTAPNVGPVASISELSTNSNTGVAVVDGTPDELDFESRERAFNANPRALVEGRDKQPHPAAATIAYRVQSGDSLSAVAQRLHVDVARLAAENALKPTSPLKIGQVLSVKLGVPATSHVVEPGDTLTKIAGQHAIDIPYLAAANNLSRTGAIKPGQKLLVPNRAAVGAQAANNSTGITSAAAAGAQPPTTPDSIARANDASTSEGQPAGGAIALAGKLGTTTDQNPGSTDQAQGNSPTAPSAKPISPSNAQPAGEDRPSAPSARGGARVNTAQEQFIASAGAAAQASKAATGVPASVTIAQAILESRWGEATIGGNNYFGIKADSGAGPAGVVYAKTKEYTSKGWITITAKFRAYDSMAQSFTDHANFLVQNSRYAEALRNAADPKRFAVLIQQAGYATDPAYAQSLIRLMDQFDLYRFDS